MSNDQKAMHKVSVHGLAELKAAASEVLVAAENLENKLKVLEACEVTIHTSPLAVVEEQN